MISQKMVTTYLQQASNPGEFKEKLINFMLSASPIERNYGIVLKHNFSSEGDVYFSFADVLKDIIDMITKNIYPGAYAIYGREKAFISAYRKLSNLLEVTQMKDQYALRLVLSDENIETKDAIYFSYLIMKNLMDYFQGEMGLLLHPVTEKKDKVTLPRELRQSLYIPKELPVNMTDYEAFFKNYIMRPKSNGYQGLHFVVRTVEGLFVEIQIWTTSMQKRNNFGSASHETHKPLDELDKACIERGPEFVKALLTPRIIGQVLTRDTTSDIFPRNLIETPAP